jgi:hypothetical protein
VSFRLQRETRCSRARRQSFFQARRSTAELILASMTSEGLATLRTSFAILSGKTLPKLRMPRGANPWIGVNTAERAWTLEANI